MENRKLTPTEELVLKRIKKANASNPVTRAELCRITGIRDNMVREIIGTLRDNGYRIVGSASTKGYYLARSEKQYKAFREEYLKKGLTFLNRIKAMDGYTEGQVSL